jgi:alanine-glyoxylate transaminase/serine-glyoxylate transaminase/serine-pyruvate transaminase
VDKTKYTDLSITPRILLGPGPSMVDPRVLQGMALPVVGHLDPQFIQVMADVQALLRYVFQTENEFTITISGTGSAGMEAAVCNFIEPGDKILVGVCGYFGERIIEMAARYGGVADRIGRPWGEAFSPEEVDKALSKSNYKLLALVHGETSTGVCQPEVKAMAEAAHKHGALLILDTVASLGGMPVAVDDWGVDICYSGSQKALSAPPGLAPLTISPRAWEVLKKRKTKVANWYLDLNLLWEYWGAPHKYHHTAPVNMNYALREALRLAAEEGLEARFARHRENAEVLWQGLENLDLALLVPEQYRLVTLTTPQLLVSMDEVAVRNQLRDTYNIEIAGGFGPLAGKVWRIGLMGFSSQKENVLLLLSALEEILA